MSSPIDDVLKRFHREYNGASEELERLIRAYIDKGYTPAAAVDRAISETGFNATIAEKVKAAIKDAAIIGAGSEAVIKGIDLYEAWDPSFMNLSQKLHGTSRIMRKRIIEVIRRQLKNSSSATQTARALYDGYGSEADVLRKQAELPKHLRELIKLSRRMEATPDAVRILQKKIRRSLRLIERLGDNGAPNKALKASYIDIVKAVAKLNDEALDRAIKVAVEEKSRYIAERIVRTESARAWYQGFIADTMDDPNVVAYRWVMSNRHPTEDICDDHSKEDAYGLGAGVFTKDKAPELPAHPHCLCHYEKVYASELRNELELKQEYKIPIAGNEIHRFTYKEKSFSTRRIENAQYHIEVSDSITLKPKMFHEMEKQISESIKLMGIKEIDKLPSFVIVGDKDVGGVLGVYKPVFNALYINDVTLNRKKFIEALKRKDNEEIIHPLVTIIHELFHWKDAQEYIAKHGPISDEREYIRALCKIHQRKVALLFQKGYDLREISQYAEAKLLVGRFDEVYTEYRTKELLKR